MHPDYNEARFWTHVSITRITDTNAPSPCWPWTAKTDPDGYGIYRVDGQDHRAHRVAHFLVRGDHPEVVMHRCDNPTCCNPAHLKGGTQADNIADMVKKGRQAKGSRNGRSKLDENQVRRIKHRLQDREAVQAQIARDFGVSKSVVRDIKRGTTWTHVPWPEHRNGVQQQH
jgi:predicted XRE-type DNA-binding protein